ncbi:MAG: type II toxin-antitoxin system RelE/ParE family toxin [Patescibacteria group bacterium]
MVTFVFSQWAEKRFKKLHVVQQSRIVSKLKQLKTHPDIISVLKPLHNFAPATHRLRVGDYRVILQLSHESFSTIKLIILDVGHRRDVYE